MCAKGSVWYWHQQTFKCRVDGMRERNSGIDYILATTVAMSRQLLAENQNVHFVKYRFRWTGNAYIPALQMEDVTGQSNQNPGEYVSVRRSIRPLVRCRSRWRPLLPSASTETLLHRT